MVADERNVRLDSPENTSDPVVMAMIVVMVVVCSVVIMTVATVVHHHHGLVAIFPMSVAVMIVATVSMAVTVIMFMPIMVVTIAMIVRMAVEVLADSECDQQDPCDIIHPTDLGQSEVVLRPKEQGDHRDTTDEMAETQEEARGEPVKPFVRLIECVRCCDGSTMAWFDTVDESEENSAQE